MLQVSILLFRPDTIQEERLFSNTIEYLNVNVIVQINSFLNGVIYFINDVL